MGFTLVFWGLLIGLAADVIPQQSGVMGLVSKLVLFVGLRKLSLFNTFFSSAKKYLIVSFFWVGCTMIVSNLLMEFWIKHWIIVERVMYSVGSLLNLLVIYFLCKGIVEMAKEFEKPEVGIIARERWNYYFSFSVISFVVGMNIFIAPSVGPFMFVLSIVINLSLLGLIKQAQKAFRFLRPPTSITHRLT